MTNGILLASVLLGALTSRGLAQDADAAKPKDDPSPLPRYHEVVEVADRAPAFPDQSLTAVRTPLPLQSTPASVSVVPRAVFEDQHGAVLGDALRNVGGVNVASGFGVFDFFTIRGFDSLSGGLVLTDGIPEPESTFYPLYNLGRIEVLKGPGAFLYGGNPLAGTVHLVRKQPRAGQFAHASASYGRFGTAGGELDANLGRADGSLGFRVNAVHRRSDSYRDDKAGDLTGVNPAFAWRPDAGTSLAVNVEYVASDFEPDSGIPLLGAQVAPVPRTRSYQSPLDFSEQRIYRLRIEAEEQVGTRTTLRGRAYATDFDWRSDGTLLVGVSPNRTGGLDVSRTLTRLDDRQRILGVQGEAHVSFSSGSVVHHLLAGLEASRLTDRFTLDVALLPSVDVLQPVETAREPLFFLPNQAARGDTRSRILAAYLVERAVVSEKLELFAGGRLDLLDYDDQATATRRDVTRLSPSVGLVYSPRPRLSFYASVGTAFAPPSTLVVGDRDPETSRQVELGVKRTVLGGRGLATLALYHLKRRGIAIPDATGVLRQTGDQRSRGVELELSAEVRKDWYLTASYALSDPVLTRFTERAIVGVDPVTFFPVMATVDRTGNRPGFAPRHLASLWTLKQLAGGLGVGAGARFVGSQFIAEDNAFAVGSYWLLDATVSYRRDRWRWSLNLQNLTDREYQTRGFGATSVVPGRPLAAFLKAELTLGSRR
jgi:iron complex outermembrane receptor protein